MGAQSYIRSQADFLNARQSGFYKSAQWFIGFLDIPTLGHATGRASAAWNAKCDIAEPPYLSTGLVEIMDMSRDFFYCLKPEFLYDLIGLLLWQIATYQNAAEFESFAIGTRSPLIEIAIFVG